MDPFQTLEVETTSASASANQEETEDVLFSRPQNLIPTNPFTNEETRFNFAIAGNSELRYPNTAIPKTSESYFTPFSDNEESEIEFDQRFERAKRNSKAGTETLESAPVAPQTKGKISDNGKSKSKRSTSEVSFGFESDEDRLDIGKLAKSIQEQQPKKKWKNWRRSSSGTPQRRQSGDCLNISDQNSTGVRTEDVIFTVAIFLSHFLSFVVDVALMCWYYWDEGDSYNFKWCSALTFLILVIGSLGILNQFNHAEKDRLDRLFIHGRRVQILVNCFPPLGTILCSFYSVQSALKAKREQVFSVHFFAIEEFAQALSRIQGFFQSAPQATLQLVILMETSTHITFGKGFLTVCSALLSLMVMTIANLPGRSDMVETSVRKGVYSPVSRIFLGIRMISSFGSRTMALTYFLMSMRCFMGSPSTVSSVVFGVCAITLPRLGFTLVDYCYHLTRVRRGRESITGQFGRLSFWGTFSGYMATIFFPMSHPLWVFWFIWVETITFITIGFVVTLTSSSDAAGACVSNLVNFFYTGIFVVLFIIIPFVLPYARATVKNQRSRKIAKMFQERERGVANLQEHHVTVSV